MKITTPCLLAQVALVVQIAALPRSDPRQGAHWPGGWYDWSSTSTSVAQQGVFIPQSTNTAQDTNVPQPSNTPQSSNVPQNTNISQTSDIPQTTNAAQTSSIAQPTTTTQTTTTAQTTTATQTTTTQTTTTQITTTQTTSTTQTGSTTQTSSTSDSVPYTPGLTGAGGWTGYPSVRSNNTLNSTVAPAPASSSTYPQALAGGQLQLSLVNNYNTNAPLNAYVTGLDSNGRLVMLQPNGDFYYPETDSTVPVPIEGNTAIPLGTQGSTTTLIIPSWISAARVWVAQGTLQFFTVQSENQIWSLVEPSVISPTDPNIDVNFGFVELTNDDTLGLYVNISYVDFVGLAVGISVTTASSASSSGNYTRNYSSQTQTVSGLSQQSVPEMCADLQAQEASDGYPWGDLCVTDPSTGELVRILSPGNHIAINATAFSDYWTSYIEEVWQKYTSEPLVINTQASAGNIYCTVSGDQLICPGSSRTYAQPSAADIFSCNSGPFEIASTDNDIHLAVVPRLCAAINRSTLLLPGGNVQPAPLENEYYSVSPTNHYSRIVHAHSAGGLGYAFSYDDVMPDGGVNESGLIAVSDPSSLGVTVQS